MAGSAVRELITKIKFLTDGSGVELAKKKVADLKAKMSQVSRQKVKVDVDTSKIDAAKKKLETVGGNLMSGGATLSAAGAGLLGGIALPVKTAADFESTMSKVKAITGSTDEQMEQLRNTARQLGRDTMFSASEAGEAMTYLGMAGWKTNQIIAAMPGLLDLAAASGGNLARTADIISDDLTAFGMSAEEATHMADVFAATSMNANTNVELMGYTFKYVGAVSGALGYKLEDLAVATGVLANNSIKGEMAGTQLRNIIMNMASPTKECAAALEKMNLEVINADGSFRPFIDVLEDIRKATKDMTAAEREEIAVAIGQKESSAGLLDIMKESEESWQNLKDKVYNADGAAKRFADTAKNNLWGKIKELKSALDDVAIELGNSLLPAFSGITDFVRTATNAIGGFIKEHPKLAGGIMATVAALGALLTIGGGLGVLIGGFMQFAAVIASVASAIAGSGIVAFFGGLAPMILLAGSAFALVAAGIRYAQNHWEEFKKLIAPGLLQLKMLTLEFQDTWASLAPYIEAVKPIFELIADIVGKVLVVAFTSLFNAGMYTFRMIGKAVSWLAEKLTAVLGPVGALSDGISGLCDKAREFFGIKAQGRYDEAVNRASATGAMQDWELGLGGSSNTVNQTNTFNVNSAEEAAATANGLAVPEFD